MEIKVEVFIFTRSGRLRGTVTDGSQDVVAVQDAGSTARGSRKDDADSDEKECRPRQPTHISR